MPPNIPPTISCTCSVVNVASILESNCVWILDVTPSKWSNSVAVTPVALKSLA